MMKNLKQISGKTITMTCPSGGLASGAGCLIGAFFGVAAFAAAAGADVELVTEGVFELTALNTSTASAGAIAYWDATNKRVTNVSTGNFPIGVYTVAKTSGPTVAEVRLDGVATAAAS